MSQIYTTNATETMCKLTNIISYITKTPRGV